VTPPPTDFTIGESLYLNFGRFTARRSGMRCLIPLLVVMLAFGAILYASGEDVIGAAMPALGGLLAGAAVWLFSYVVLLPRRLRRNYRESASLHERMRFTPSETGFECKQASGIWHPKWRDIRKWTETSEFFAIFPNRTAACILPRDQFAEEVLAYVRDRLKESGLTQPGKFRK